MTNLDMLKQNLEITNSLRDAYLETLLDAAEGELVRHGITPPDGNPADYQNLVVMYAAYYYRKRAEVTTFRGSEANAMPRMLRFALHNYLLAQKMKEAEG